MSLDQVDTQDVFIPTQKGNDELTGGSTRLSTVALELLVLFDGKHNLGEVAVRIKNIPAEEIRSTAQALASGGLIELARGEIEVNIRFSTKKLNQ